MKPVKDVIKTVKGTRTQDGAGVSLIRVIGHDDVYEADPFLMLDAFDSTNPRDYIKGFPMHPHRGIETVTYLIDGQIDHRDSLGNSGTIRSGQAQWMTAGSGILHEEMPQKSPRLFGLQLWVNLPQKDKMVPPRYFEITEDRIPTVKTKDATVKIIAGTYAGTAGVKTRYVRATMLDIYLKPGKSLSIDMDQESTVLIYILSGSGAFGPEGVHVIEAQTAAIFGWGDSFFAQAGDQELRFVLFSGRPLREPIAWVGPIVMNTKAELDRAFSELQADTFIK